MKRTISLRQVHAPKFFRVLGPGNAFASHVRLVCKENFSKNDGGANLLLPARDDEVGVISLERY